MKLYPWTCLWIFLWATGIHAQAPQVVYFEHTTIEQGLSQNSIQCILQDKIGYLWFGTGDGLNQYDGYKFNIFNTDPLNPKLLSSGFIQCIYQDHNGVLWIGTDGGLNSYNPKTGKVTRFEHDDKNANSIPGNNIRAIAEYQGRLWIGTDDAGLCSFSPDKKSFEREHVKGSKINCLYSDNSKLWIGTEDNGVCIFEKGVKKYWGGSIKINCIYMAKGKTLIGSDAGLFILDAANKEISYKHNDRAAYSISNDQVTSITEDHSGNIWIGTLGGLNAFNIQNGRFAAYHHDASHVYSLSDDRVTSLFTDRTGKVWVGTYSGGIDAINPPNVVFKSYRHEAGNPTSLSYDDISSIWEDHDKSIWVGTLGGGLNLFNPSTEAFKVFHKGPGNSISSNNVNCIVEDHNGVIWIGTQDGGLNSYDTREGKFQTYKAGTGGLTSNTILALREDNDNNLWIGTDQAGIVLLNVDTREIKPFRDKDNVAAQLNKYQVRCFYLDDQKGRMWIGTLGGGLFGYDPKTQQLKNYTHDKNQKNSISDNRVFSIYEDLNGRVWIGTNEGGLNLFDPESGIFRFFTEHDGLPNNVIYGIAEDKGENLWLNTNKGICKFSPPTETKSSTIIHSKVKVSRNNNNSAANRPNTADIKIRIYDTRDGLPTGEFNIGAYCKTIEGRMYLGSISGLVTFDPDSVRDNPYIPPVVITDFKLFNRSVQPGDSFKVLKNPLSETHELKLKYNQNVLSFEFTALNYINPKKNRYAYKLDGYDNDWIYTDAQRRFTTYTNLEPGEYTFLVKGSNNDGIWNEKGSTLHITITPPFWKTWWFRILLVVVLGGIIYFSIWFRLNQIRKTEEQKTEVNKMVSEARLIALRAQMNPHFIFNSLNSIQQFIYNNDKEEASTYLSKFSKLIRQILEHSTQGAILLQDEISILSLYLELEALRFQHKFSFSIDIDEDIDAGYTEIPSMLIQPYIENAILHGLVNKEGKGHISIYLQPDKESENMLLCTIQDDGVGREKAMQLNKNKVFKYKQKSMGMSVTKDRLTILNQYQKKNIAVEIIDLKDDTGEALGTKVNIQIPVEEL